MAEKTEPQNTLTKQFTEAEWEALKDLRGKLPEIFAEAYPDAKSTPINIWGVNLDPSGEPDAKASVVLIKFLRARELNVQAAQEMLTATLKWRQEFDVEACKKEEFPPEIFGQLGHVYGKDKEGRPVTYNIYGGNQDLKAVFSDLPRFLRWRVAFMEKGIEFLDFENIAEMLQIHDYEGVSMTSRDAESKRAAAEATALFQAHYPEFLHKKYFVNVPRIMAWIFWLFRPIMASKTFAKLEMVGTGADTIGNALLPEIDAKELPKRYGGEAEGF